MKFEYLVWGKCKHPRSKKSSDFITDPINKQSAIRLIAQLIREKRFIEFIKYPVDE